MLFALLAFALSGCINARVEARVTIQVEPNGSGTFSAAMGMTRSVKDLLGSRGQDPLLAFTRSISTETDVVSLRQWTEGGLEWVEGSFPFANLRELNRRLEGNELIADFSLTRQKKLSTDRFVFNAVINPVLEDSTDSIIDPSRFFDFRVIVILPGEVVATNGYYDAASGEVWWPVSGTEQQRLSATSEMRNWANLGILLAPLVGIGLLALLGLLSLLAVWLYRKRAT